jgi:glutathionylspermidine synthase
MFVKNYCLVQMIANAGFYILLPQRNNIDINWMEPAWKAILSNKMLPVILHELFPDSPYVLPARFNQGLPGT